MRGSEQTALHLLIDHESDEHDHRLNRPDRQREEDGGRDRQHPADEGDQIGEGREDRQRQGGRHAEDTAGR